MKPLIYALLICGIATAQASENDLLERALNCKLADEELPSLIKDLAAKSKAFSKPVAQFGAPTVDVYEIPSPAKAYGYSSKEIFITPGRTLLGVEGKKLPDVVKTLKLEEEEYSPARRLVRPTVSTVAFPLVHRAKNNKLAIGCEYANEAAVKWIDTSGDASFFGL